ncbi:MAG TPA: hypothetical protein DIU15_01445 [Deltaproteobacteria bacterium]|nr:hypothetical protein [Deltaproteobacteria bacterium]HCP44689.1 hypothetical protein [Deltaproteobacteria bacterium]
MKVAGWHLASRAVRLWVLLVVLVVPLAMGISAAEVGGSPALSWQGLLQLLGPGIAAVSVALTIARSRVEGSWDGWTALGLSAGARLVPMVLCALVGLVCLSGLVVRPLAPSAMHGALTFPAPVAEEGRLWFQRSTWATPDLDYWKARPATLSTPDLMVRLWRPVPQGARQGVDRAELLLRCSWASLWLLAVPLGAVAGLRWTQPRNRRGGAPGVAASLEAVGWVLIFQVSAFVAAAYASSMT